MRLVMIHTCGRLQTTEPIHAVISIIFPLWSTAVKLIGRSTAKYLQQLPRGVQHFCRFEEEVFD
jgi:hypothetical protein